MGLIAHWPFNGDTLDYSGNQQPLTINGTHTLDNDGKIGQTYNMTSGSYVTEITDIPQSNTISLWVKHNGPNWLSEALYGTRLGGNGFMLYRNDGDTDGYYRAYYWYVNTSDVITAYNAWPGISNCPIDSWFHIIQVRTADGHLKLYKDGVLVSNQTPPSDFKEWDNNGAKLAFHAQGNGSGYTGGDTEYNDIRVYNHALSTKEVQELYKTKILHYTFNDFQEPTTNLANTLLGSVDWTVGNLSASVSRSTIELNKKYRITSTTGGAFRMYFDETKLTDNLPYNLSFKFKLISGGNTFNMTDWCDTSLQNNITKTYGDVEFNSAYGVRSTYNSTYRFTDFTISDNTVVDIWDVQLEQKEYHTDFTQTNRGGVVRDVSGFNNNSTLSEVTTPQWVGDSKLGDGAYKFLTSSNRVINSAGKLQYAEDFTISAWLKRDGLGLWVRAVDIGLGDYPGLIGIHSNDLGFFSYRLANGVDLGFMYYNINDYTTQTEWFHIAVQHRRVNLTTIERSAYVNGNLSEQVDVTDIKLDYNTNISIGGSGGRDFNGIIDDVRIYQTALTSDEVLELYQTRAQLDDSGNLHLNKIETNGFKSTEVDYTTWLVGNTSATSGTSGGGYWSRNGGSDENLIITKNNPTGQLDIVWASLSNNVGSDSDGGFNGGYFNIDYTKLYRYSVWVKRENVGDGRTYLGINASPDGLYTVGQQTSLNTNPYSQTWLDGDITHNNEWVLMVHYIQPYLTNTSDPLVTATKGIYKTDGTRISSSGVEFAWSNTNTTCRMRSYLYYSTTIDERHYWYRPRFEMVDGNEPSIDTLLRCAEHRPLIDEDENFVYDNKSIGESGVGRFTNTSEVGITEGLIGYWKLDGDTKDYSGLGNDGTSVGATVTSGLKNLAYNITPTNQHIELGSNIIYKTTGGWTISSWVKYDTVAGGYNNTTSPANFTGHDSTQYNSWYWGVLNNKLALWNISPGVWKYGSTIIQPNTWYNCVLVCSDDGTSYQMYLNGVPEGGDHTTYSWNPAYSGLKIKYLGAGSPNIRVMDGKLAETKIFNRVLTSEEILIEYKFGLTNTGMQLKSDGTLFLNKEINESL